MVKYTAKPITVEATQWHRPGDHPKIVEVIQHRDGVAISEFEKERWRGIGKVAYAHVQRTDRGSKVIGYIRPGDWVIEHNKNDLTIMTNADFRSNFILK